ncbi:MAG: SDR family oxidoreductase [Treponema sp.]|jgi:nucleoside-diphosphate-sugar epimerase|nr:SDR family oxidoreductase [Treponema sp.]
MKIFVTGATGYIGSAVVKELVAAGHEALGLARSDKAAAALAAAGVAAHRGSLEDLESLKSGVAMSDGVIHTAFLHDFSNFAAACETDRRAIEAIGATLENSNRPFVIASGLAGLNPGGVATEEIAAAPPTFSTPRSATETALIEMASRGVRSAAVRIAPTAHGPGDHGFISQIIKIAQTKGISAYIGDGNNRWPAVHVLDAAKLFRFALEKAPAGTRVHAVAEEGIPFREIAAVISRRLQAPLVSISAEEAAGHFGWLGNIIGLDTPASSVITQKSLNWRPSQPSLLSDMNSDAYFVSA